MIGNNVYGGGGGSTEQLGIYPIGADSRPKGNVTVPSGVTSLYQYIFDQNNAVTSVNLPSTLTLMGDNIFRNCTQLLSINIPTGITSLGTNCFLGCTSLSNITKLIENKTIIPTDCKLVKLTFTRDSVGSATISKISREYNVDVNIMLANVDVVNADALGGIIASIEGTKENVQRAIDFLHESNVKVEVIHHA